MVVHDPHLATVPADVDVFGLRLATLPASGLNPVEGKVVQVLGMQGTLAVPHPAVPDRNVGGVRADVDGDSTEPMERARVDQAVIGPQQVEGIAAVVVTDEGQVTNRDLKVGPPAVPDAGKFE